MSRLFSAAGRVSCACAGILLPFAAHAAANPTTSPIVVTRAANPGDTAWLLTATALVLSMTLPGLVAFYSGLVRSKNVLSVAMQCFAIACLVSLLWVLGGYGMAFGDGGTWQALIGAPGGVLDLKRDAL